MAAGAEALSKCERAIRLGVSVDDHDVMLLSQSLMQTFHVGREGGKLVKLQIGICRKSKSNCLAVFFVGPEKCDS
jgi:hypothetical protein